MLCGSVLALALAACGIFGSDDNQGTPAAPSSENSADGGGEGGPVVSGPGTQPTFTLGVSADALPITQGAKAKLTVSVSRSAAAQAANLPIVVTAKPPAKITAGALTIAPTDLTGELELTADGDAEQGDAAIELSATSGEASAQATAKLLVRGAPGKVDTTFGTNGTAHVTQVSLTSGTMLVQPDQKIIAIGTSDTTTVVLRLLPTGALDSSFGGGKVSFTGLGKAWGATLQPDGKILIAGSPTTTAIAVARLLPDATMDTTFGALGIATINLPSGAKSYASPQVAVAPDGTIVVGFTWTQTNYYDYWAIAHMTDKGALVTTTGGFAKGRWTTTNDGISGVGVRAGTGKIFGVGANGDGLGIGIFQLTQDHAVDSTFGSVSTPGLTFVSRPQVIVGNTQKLMEELPDHSVIAGFLGNKNVGNKTLELVRFRADGNGIDTTFGTDGFASVPGIPAGLCVGAGGTIITTTLLDFNRTSWGLNRLLPHGTVDPSFADGKTIVQTDAWVQSLAVASQADGRILALGISGLSPNTAFFVQRFWN
ncbi:RTX toxin [Labilithrix luteola]|uniref:RTX toxin n=1 Tax=Labilithrix luteola TaxID=1391654 RepID=A0A0K1Q1I7_9BACT|nr:RTX toxin [Labilithrix luteola]